MALALKGDKRIRSELNRLCKYLAIAIAHVVNLFDPECIFVTGRLFEALPWLRAPFEFIPFDFFKNADRDAMGQPMSAKSLAGRVHLTTVGKQHIIGIQGQLWGENLRSSEKLEYLAFPRIICLAERAWARTPAWARISQAERRNAELEEDWNQFANRLGQRELPRLDYLFGSVNYRLPPPGVVVRKRRIWANVAFPGMVIRYTTGGSNPDQNSPRLLQSIPFSPGVRIRTFDTRGRGSRTVHIDSIHSH